MKPRVYVTRILPKEAMDRINSFCDAKTWDGPLPPPREVLEENVTNIEGLLSLLTDKIDAALMDKAPKLKVISNYAVGFDNIDIPAATKTRDNSWKHPRRIDGCHRRPGVRTAHGSWKTGRRGR